MRFLPEAVKSAFRNWGIKNGKTWYFREGSLIETGAEKPPFIYLKDEQGEFVDNLREAVIRLSSLEKNHRVIINGDSAPPMYIRLDIGEGDELYIAGVWVWLKANGRYRPVYSNGRLTDAAEYYIQQKINGDEFVEHLLQEMGEHPTVRKSFKQLQAR